MNRLRLGSDLDLEVMNEGAGVRPGIGGRAAEIGQTAFYALLAVFITADLARAAVRASRSFWGRDPAVELCPLDSFSACSTAATVLRRQAESRYQRAREAASAPALSQVHEPRGTGVRGRPIPEDLAEGAAYEPFWITPLEQLRATVGELDVDLDEKLLVVCWENRLDTQAVDRYLQLLHEAPEHPEVAGWVHNALDSAQCCGRAEEVVAALRHVVQFHPGLRTAKLLTARVNTWRAGQPAGRGPRE